MVGPYLDLEVGLALEAFDDHQVAGRQPAEHLFQGRLGRLAHDGVAQAADQRDLGGAGRAMAPGIGAGLVDVDIVVSMLDGGDAPAAPHKLGDQPLGQGGLAGILPAGDAEHALLHHATIRSAWA